MQRQAGFTLIEIMVTIAIIAILAAIAIPNYADYVRRGKIQEATATLLAMKTKMEQYFQDNRSYVTPGAPVLDACVAGSTVQVPPTKYFTIDCNTPARTVSTFTITANGGVAGGDQSMAGISFTINQAGVQQTFVTPGSNMSNYGYVPNGNCWTIKRGGQC
jgi:type IV pilus assembly protein PilE